MEITIQVTEHDLHDIIHTFRNAGFVVEHVQPNAIPATLKISKVFNAADIRAVEYEAYAQGATTGGVAPVDFEIQARASAAIAEAKGIVPLTPIFTENEIKKAINIAWRAAHYEARDWGGNHNLAAPTVEERTWLKRFD